MCACWYPARGSSAGASAALRCAALALLCAALARASVDRASADRASVARAKRAEMSPVPFVMGSRYGRSPERVMSPRNDRFFMGSRYGKRSEVVEEGEELQGVWEGCEDDGTAQCRRLLCRYAGVPHLFKCVRTNELQFARRNVADTRAGDSNE